MRIERVKMLPRDDGKLPPNPYRYACNYGHLHPSHRGAVKCHRRQADLAGSRARAALAKAEGR